METEMKGYRTLLFNVLAAVITVLIGYNWTEVLAAWPWAPPLIIAAGNFVLRIVTTTPIGEATS
jgi:hypothetical protein